MLGLYCVLSWASTWPPKVHGLVLGAFAFVFGFSERLFWNVISELNATLRSSSLSVEEAQKFRAVISPGKVRLWRRWFLMTTLQLINAASATLILGNFFAPVGVIWLLLAGYGSVLLTVPIMVSFYANYRNVDSFRDNFAFQEVQRKQREKLASELGTGPSHDSPPDPQLEGYTSVVK